MQNLMLLFLIRVVYILNLFSLCICLRLLHVEGDEAHRINFFSGYRPQNFSVGFLNHESNGWIDARTPITVWDDVRWTGDKDITYVHKADLKNYLEVLCHADTSEEKYTKVCCLKAEEGYYIGERKWVSEVSENPNDELMFILPLNVTWEASYPIPISYDAWINLLKPKIPQTLAPAFKATLYDLPTLKSHGGKPEAIWFRPIYWGISTIVDIATYTNTGLSAYTAQIITLIPLLLPSNKIDGIYGIGAVTQDDIDSITDIYQY